MSDPLRADVDAWIDALVARHTAAMSPPQFFKAIRALSARYVESRGQLPDRSPIDSAGKRAAFAAFYAPLHFLTTREIVRALAVETPALKAIQNLADLGCGTGVAGAAWALECDPAPAVGGIDKNEWSLAEAVWNWRQLGARGRARRGDLIAAAEHLVSGASARGRLDGTGVLFGWCINELAEGERQRLVPIIRQLAERGASILVIEPIARSATPWWPRWVDMVTKISARSRADDWKFNADLPSAIARTSEAAGFKERTLSARTILIAP